MATRRFRPVPADIHEACKARKTEIAIAEGMARKVIAARGRGGGPPSALPMTRRERRQEREPKGGRRRRIAGNGWRPKR